METELKLKEAFLMFAYSPKGSLNSVQPEPGIAAAVLMELVREGKIALEGKRLKILSHKASSDDLNNDIFQYLKSRKKPLKIKDFLSLLNWKSFHMKKRVRAELLKKRVLTEERKRFLFIPYRLYPLSKGRLKDHLSRHIRATIDGKVNAEEYYLSLIALLEAGQILRQVYDSRKEYRAHKTKIKEILNNSKLAKGMSETIQAMQMALITTTVIIPATTS